MSVSVLKYEESARFDPDQLELLCRTIGETRAETEAAEALDRINRALKGIEQLTHPAKRARLAARLECLIAASDKIGMATLGRVARDVRATMASGDHNAHAATICRLQRVGERSMQAVFELEDQTI